MLSPISNIVGKHRWQGRVPITITLATAIGLLVLIAVGVVFGVGVWLAQKNTLELLIRHAKQSVTADVNQFEQHLRPAEYQTRFLARQIASAQVDPSDNRQFNQLLIGSLAGAIQIDSVRFISPQLQVTTAYRNWRDNSIGLKSENKSGDPATLQELQDAAKGASWGSPHWLDEPQRTYLNRMQPIWQEGKLIGAVIAATSIEELSSLLSEQDIQSKGNSFILYGRDEVLAHWLLIDGYPGRTNANPLPRLASFGDPVLSSLGQSWEAPDDALEHPNKMYTDFLKAFNSHYAIVYRRLPEFGPQPMIVGSYFELNKSSTDIWRMIAALIAGIIALLISLTAAIALGHRIARPIVRFSAAAAQIKNLDVSKVEELPGSRLREFNDQSITFNSMLRALRWFELYVPRKVVERLIRQVDVEESISDERKITVMFTDIVAFSGVVKGMQATEVADFVNHHLSLVVTPIEAQEGTVDKFIGDAVMAFWGAPDEQPDSAQRACRAAMAISTAIRDDNLQRRTRGNSPISIRIGIHTGMATVGNIGAPGRLNYTIIGETVNIGQRLEQLGKELNSPEDDVSILVSDNTASELGADFNIVAVGEHTLRGHSQKVSVYRIETPDD